MKLTTDDFFDMAIMTLMVLAIFTWVYVNFTRSGAEWYQSVQVEYEKRHPLKDNPYDLVRGPVL